MSNPGPASTQTNHPSNLASNQALRLLASAQGVNLNQVGDTVANVLSDSGNYSVQSIIVANASTNLTTVSGTPLYIRCTTAQGAAATADVFIYGYDLTFLS